MVQKKSKKISHPEIEEPKEVENHYFVEDYFFEDEDTSNIIKKAVSTLPDSIMKF